MDIYKENNRLELEKLLLNNDFVRLAKQNNPEEIQAFIHKYPGSKQCIQDAILLISNMKMEETEVPSRQIEEDYQRLMDRLPAGRKKQYVMKALSTVAASVAIGLIIAFGISNDKDAKDTELVYSLLDSANVKTEDVQIIAGTSQMNIKDSATIKQTEAGAVIVDEKEISDFFIAQAEYLQLIVPYGKRSTINFSDGTVVWVNSGTTIVYPQRFNKGKREIFVDGEIYIEVAKDKSRPFIVHSRKFDISVLGTKFNVNSYDTDPMASVVLVEGCVEVSIRKTKNKLSPDQGLFYENDIAEIKQVDVYPHICWKDGIMKLNGESLDVIFNRLARYYRVEFDYDQKITTERYNGKLNLSESIENILHNLSLATDFTYEKEENIIHIKND
ncbi:MAG: FecR family protein [Prevotella sp.]|jgi:hypothetical protein|nr:FecR family protein [Prevotella sp.]